jgi:hypothetical protein
MRRSGRKILTMFNLRAGADCGFQIFSKLARVHFVRSQESFDFLIGGIEDFEQPVFNLHLTVSVRHRQLGGCAKGRLRRRCQPISAFAKIPLNGSVIHSKSRGGGS